MAEENYDIIDQYLSKKMEGDALSAFEQQLAADHALRQEVADRQAMRTFLSNIEKTKAFKAKLEGLEKKHFAPETSIENKPAARRKIPWFWIGLILLSLLAFLFFRNYNGTTTPITYPQMAIHEPLELTQKTNEPTAEVISKFSHLYNSANYKAALPLIETYLSDNAEDNEVLLARGICEMELDQLASARKTFEEIATGGSIYRELGTWYLALSYLKVDDRKQMKYYLQQIPSTASDIYEKAQKLLQE